MSVKTSKFLSYVLRHAPESIGLTLDGNGWASVDELLSKANASGTHLDRQILQSVVDADEKKRFTFSSDTTRIRAAQGHSVEVELGHAAAVPPASLFHGTATRFLDAIMASGLKPMSRRHVHLSLDRDTALKVGQRHGKPVVLQVNAQAMHGAGKLFWLADNGVWLTDTVEPAYLTIEPADIS